MILVLAFVAGAQVSRAEGPKLDIQEMGIGPGGAQDLFWVADPQHPGYLMYDVVQGDLAALRSSGGNFTLSLMACLSEDTPPSRPISLPLPSSGQQFFFLVRAQQDAGVCGAGSWNESFAVAPLRQPADRDAEIIAAAAACPCP